MIEQASASLSLSLRGRFLPCRILGPTVAFFLWSRAAIWAVALLAWYLHKEPSNQLPHFVGLAPSHTEAGWYPPWLHDSGPAHDVWARWDSAWFLAVAHHGYSVGESAAAFYPLYPLLVGGLGRAFLGHYVLAGVVVSLAGTFAAFLLLERLAARQVGEAAARRAVLYLGLFPMALFLQAVYSEALFLALALSAFLAAERSRFAAAGALAGLALLTRPIGIALLPPLALIAWGSPQPRRALAWLGLVPLMFAVYPLTLWLETGHPFAFVHAEGNSVWRRHLSPAGPLGGIWGGLQDAWHGAGRIAAEIGGADVAHREPLYVAVHQVEQLLYLVVFLILAWFVWRRLGAVWGLFAAAALAVVLSFPSERLALLSLPRFCLVIFPFSVALAALVGARPRLNAALLVASSLLLAWSTVHWAFWEWVS